MRKANLFLNVVAALSLVVMLLGSTSMPASASNEEPKADPRLLQMAEENPDATFMVIVQKDAKNKDLKDMEVEDEVLKGGGQVKKQLDLIVSFSAEMTGKEIVKLAEHPKVRWISADAPMVSATIGELSPVNSVVVNAPLAVTKTFTVTSTSNSGTGSLRQAITDANSNAGTDTIKFNISGTGVHTITPTSALPTITGAVILDATTDDSFAANGNKPAIILDGNNLAADGLVLSSTADGSTIRGLVIRDFGTSTSHDGIEIQSGSDGNTIAGNYIGSLTATGTNAGSADSNAGHGIRVLGKNNTIGGATTADRNVISGNWVGIYISGSGASGNTVVRNLLGTDASGTVLIQNNSNNIDINSSAANNLIGGVGAGNVIVYSGNDGITIWGNPATTGNKIQGNTIGTDATGTLDWGNRGRGVIVTGGAIGNTIGGLNAGEGNVIAFNDSAGVSVDESSSYNNAILGNSIYSNMGLGIDLGSSGVTANNGATSSSLSNYGMDYPVIIGTALGGGWLNVTGYVGTTTNQSGVFSNARVEFFKSAMDSSGYGEGQTFIGYLTTDTYGNFSGSLSGSGITSSDKLTATATDGNNNTSEFGPNLQVTVVPFSAFRPTTRADQLSSSLTGQNVTVAVVDSGIAAGHPDFMIGNQMRVVYQTSFGQTGGFQDLQGHGTHVAGIIGGSGSASNGLYKGIAPNVDLVSLRVSDKDGMTYESNVVDSLQWIYNNKSTYNIIVVNISMNSTVAQSYHTSPLDAAVEILWFNGIVVVVSAGNNGTGSGPVTLYPPANDPFVITVGAADDKGTASLADDTLAAFSAFGTTEDGFAKPDLIAPGRNVVAPLSDKAATIYTAHPLHRVGDYYFRMSGTSMSTPVVTGAVALLLQDEPGLTPDQVKYRLKASANKTWSGYDVTKMGAGYLDTYDMIWFTTTQSANTGTVASQMLSTGSTPITWGSVGWNSVGWNSVGWNSVGWNSVGWNSVGWNSVGWNSTLWEDD